MRNAVRYRKKKRDPRPYVGLHKEFLFKNQKWADLSAPARSLYLLMKGKYNPGKNDGLVKLPYREIKKYGYVGLKKNETISRCFRELEEAELIKRILPGGGLPKKCTYYKLTGSEDEYGL
ncbi:hypothetical protein GF327_05395 [Candidatus Woesearchaeota archaeon]|nr:hypothetical protein [Candidatus Woesearchaeota archaeon]